MASRTVYNLIARGVSVIGTTRDALTNTVLALLGSDTGKLTESSSAEWWQHTGFASRPAKPDPSVGGPQAVIVRGADVDACIASRDTRCHGLYASLDYGEFCVYAPGYDAKGQARVLGKANGNLAMYTRVGNDPAGAGMTVQLDAQNNAVTILNGLGFGLIVDANGITLTSGKASLTLGADGTVSLVGMGQTQIDGTTIVLGSKAVPVANAALHGPTGISGAPSLKVIVE